METGRSDKSLKVITASGSSPTESATTPTTTYCPSESDCAYLAGLIDGEGHISVVEIKSGKFTQRRLVITNTHLPVLVWVTQRFGGKIYTPNKYYNGGTKISFQWYCYGDDVDRILLHVVSYLKIKQMEARLALVLGSNRAEARDPSDLRKMTIAIREQEQGIREQIIAIRQQHWTKADVPPYLLERKPKVTECQFGHGPAAWATTGHGCRVCRAAYERRYVLRQRAGLVRTT
jgi:hypothetical protein